VIFFSLVFKNILQIFSKSGKEKEEK